MIRTLAAAPPVPTRTPSPLVIVATALGFILVQLDVSIVNVALATIGREFHSSVAALQWVVDAYTVTFAALLLSGGAFGDRVGARRVFIAGFGIFICSSMACGLAPTAAVLIGTRIAQGAGAAALTPCSQSPFGPLREASRSRQDRSPAERSSTRSAGGAFFSSTYRSAFG